MPRKLTRKRKLPANVSAFVDRHGRERFRFRKSGQPTRYFHAPFGTPAFDAELQAFRSEAPRPAAARHAPGTVGWLAARYRVSGAFCNRKNAQTERTAWAKLEPFIAEFAQERIADFRFDHLEAVLRRTARPRIGEDGRKRGGPNAARNLLRELKPFFRYAVKLGLIATSPAELVDPPRAPRGGFHTWTVEEIAQFRARWPLGSKARLAMEILLWTGLRRGDAATFGRKHLRGGLIEITPGKTGDTVWLPAAPQLVEAIEAMAVTGTESFLVTDYGKPFTRAGLGAKIRDWCNAAGLPHCTAHGLRKAIATLAANAGATERELMALGGWRTAAEVTNYTRAANQAQLAKAALDPVIAHDLANRTKKVSQSGDTND